MTVCLYGGKRTFIEQSIKRTDKITYFEVATILELTQLKFCRNDDLSCQGTFIASQHVFFFYRNNYLDLVHLTTLPLMPLILTFF